MIFSLTRPDSDYAAGDVLTMAKVSHWPTVQRGDDRTGLSV
jgi:hypothetical protein